MMFHAIDIADSIVTLHGKDNYITNLMLNKLVYFAYADSLANGIQLFDDHIEAWRYGPVERTVFNAYRDYGKVAVREPSGEGIVSEASLSIAHNVWKRYGFMTAIDLMNYSHRDGSAWKSAYVPQANIEITNDMILASRDGKDTPPRADTLAASIDDVRTKWKGALNMLADI
jgi:uncharacterized phage-associated protein